MDSIIVPQPYSVKLVNSYKCLSLFFQKIMSGFRLVQYTPKICLVLISLFCYISYKTLTVQPSYHSTDHVFIPPTIAQLKDPVLQESDVKVMKEIDSSVGIKSKNVEYDVNKSVTDQKCMNKWLGTPPSILKNPHHDLKDEEITCSALLFGNSSDNVYRQAKTYMDHHKKKRPSNTYFQENINDIGCIKFKLSRGYRLNALDQEEENFPIAFNILMHKDIDQVEMLLRSIYRPQNSYCIHIDSKSDPDVVESVRAIASCFDNVFLASRLERVVYAGYSRLQADINCMKDQLKSPVKWKYLLNVAGQEMPAKSNLEMVKILKIYNGANDVEGIYGARIHRSRFENEWIEVDPETNHAKLNKTGKRNPKPPYDIDIVRGSAYGVFSRNFTEWIIENEKPRALLEWSKKTWSPDEHYWATLHHRYTNPHLHPPGGYSG